MTDAIELASFTAVMIEEAGPKFGDVISTDRNDPGNWTSGKVGVGQFYGSPWGLSAPVCAKRFPGIAAKDITQDMALSVFDSDYYAPVARYYRGGLPLAVVDDAYNAGVGSSRKLLNQCSINSNSEPIQAIKDFSSARLSMYHHFKNWPRYKLNWGARIGRIEGKSLKLCQGVTNSDIVQHKNDIQDQVKQHTTKAGTAAAGGALVTYTPINGPFLYINLYYLSVLIGPNFV